MLLELIEEHSDKKLVNLLSIPTIYDMKLIPNEEKQTRKRIIIYNDDSSDNEE